MVKSVVASHVVKVPAAAVLPPIVVPSIAPPFISAVGITVEPVNVTLPSARVIRSVSSVWPIVAPLIFTLSTTSRVHAEFVPIVTPSIVPPFISAVGITVVPVNVTLPFARVIRSVSAV